MIGIWKKSIGSRFIILTLVVVFAVSLISITIEGIISHQREVLRIGQEVIQIRESHLPSIVSSLWLTDYNLLQQQVDAIGRFPSISRIEVETDDGQLFSAGRPRHKDLQILEEVLRYTNRGSEVEIGRLHLFIDQAEIRTSVIKGQLFSLLSHGITMLLIAASLALLFHHHIGKHLRQLSSSLRADTRENLESPIRIARKKDYPDELSLLVRSINLMRHNLNEHLHERELRIAEMHHRIKNDLGFVYSMLYLQARQSKSEEASELINEAGRRISVVTRIYERLYTERNFLEVSIRPLFEQIINDLDELGIITEDSLSLRIEDLVVPTKVSISMGIILNELITNGVKYAGEDNSAPKLDIAVTLLEDGKHVSISVKDDGEGLPSSVLEDKEFGFGLTVIQALVSQHRGSMNLRNDQGAVISVTLEY